MIEIDVGGNRMTLSFYHYPNCSTCRKAKKWLDIHDLDYNTINIVEENPTQTELLNMIETSDLKPRQFFNTSGRVYRELNMKEKLQDATMEDMVKYLASDGMLIKRPIVTDGQRTTVGFKEEMFQENWHRESKD